MLECLPDNFFKNAISSYQPESTGGFGNIWWHSNNFYSLDTKENHRFCHFGKDHSKSKINFKRSEYFLVTIPTTKRSKIKFEVQI